MMNESTARGFKVPKIKRQESKDNLRTLELKSRDAQEISDLVTRSYLERNYKSPWQLKQLHLVDNKELEESYRAKKAEMKDDGRHSRDLVDQYAFLMFRDSTIMARVIKQGLLARPMPFNALGASKFGVYLCRNADVQLRLADGKGLTNCTLVVFKITLGKCKVLAQQSMTEGENIEPTPNYDCHVSQSQAKPSDSLYLQLARSQVYLYEYTDECIPSERPRQCLPYAILSFEKLEGSEATSGYGKQTTSSTLPTAKSEQAPGDSTSKMKRTGSYSDSVEKPKASSMGQRSWSDSNVNPQKSEDTPIQASIIRNETRPPRDPRLSRMGVNPVDPRLRPGDPRMNPVDPRLNRGSPRFNTFDSKANVIDSRTNPLDPRIQARPPGSRLNIAVGDPWQNQSDPRINAADPRMNTGNPLQNYNDPRLNRADPRVTNVMQNLPNINPSDPRLSSSSQPVIPLNPRLDSSEPRISSISQNRGHMQSGQPWLDPRLKGNPDVNLHAQNVQPSRMMDHEVSEENEMSSSYQPTFGPPERRFQTYPSGNQQIQESVSGQYPVKPPPGDLKYPRDPRLRNRLVAADTNTETISPGKSTPDSAFLDQAASKLQRKKLSIDEYKKKVVIQPKQDTNTYMQTENEFNDQVSNLSGSYYSEGMLQSNQPDNFPVKESMKYEHDSSLPSGSDMSLDSDSQSPMKINFSVTEEEYKDSPYDSPYSPENAEAFELYDPQQEDIVDDPYKMMQTLSELPEPDDSSMSPKPVEEEPDSSKFEIEGALIEAIKKLVEQSPDMEVLTQAIQVLGQTHDMHVISEALKKTIDSSIKSVAEETTEHAKPTDELVSPKGLKKPDSPLTKAVRKTLAEIGDDCHDEKVEGEGKEEAQVKSSTEMKHLIDKVFPVLGNVADIPLPPSSLSKSVADVPVLEKNNDPKVEEVVKFYLDKDEEESKKTELSTRKKLPLPEIKTRASPGIGFSPHKSLLSETVDKDERQKTTKWLFGSDKDERQATAASKLQSDTYDSVALDKDERLHAKNMSSVLPLSESAIVEDVDERRHHSRSVSPAAGRELQDVDERQSHSRSISPALPNSSLQNNISEQNLSSSLPGISSTLDVDERPISRSQSPVISKSTPAIFVTDRRTPTPIMSPDPETDDSLMETALNKNNNNISDIPLKQMESLDTDLRQSRNENEFGDVDWRWTAASEMGDVDLRAKPSQSQASDFELPPVFESVDDFWAKRENKEGDMEFRKSYGLDKSDIPQYHESYESYSTSKKEYESYETSSKTPIPSYSTSGNVYGEYSTGNKSEMTNMTVPPMDSYPAYQTPGLYPQSNQKQPFTHSHHPIPQEQTISQQQSIFQQQPVPSQASNIMNFNSILGSVNLDFANLKNILATVQKPAENTEPVQSNTNIPGELPLAEDEEVTSNLPAFVTGLCKESPKKDTTLTKYSGRLREAGRKHFFHKEESLEKTSVKVPCFDPTIAPQLQKQNVDGKSQNSIQNVDSANQSLKQEESHFIEKTENQKEPIQKNLTEKENFQDNKKGNENELKKLNESDKNKNKSTGKEKSSGDTESRSSPMIFSVGDIVKHVRETEDNSANKTKFIDSHTVKNKVQLKEPDNKTSMIFSVGDMLRQIREPVDKQEDDKAEEKENKRKKSLSPLKQEKSSKREKKKEKDRQNTSLNNMTPYQLAIMESLETSDLRIKHDDSIISDIDKESPKSKKQKESSQKDLYSDINQGFDSERLKTNEKETKSDIGRKEFHNAHAQMDLNDVSDNSDDESFGLVIDLGETPAKKPDGQIKKIENYGGQETTLMEENESQDSATWKESSADHEVADDCLVIEMEQEKPEVVDLTEDDNDMGMEAGDKTNAEKEMESMKDDNSDGLPLAKKIKLEKSEEDEEREKRLAEEAKLAEVFSFDKADQDSELDINEHAPAPGDRLKRVLGQPRKKIVINLKSAGRKAKNAKEGTSGKKEGKIEAENKTEKVESKNEKSKTSENQNEKPIPAEEKDEKSKLETASIPRLVSRNLSEQRAPSPITVLRGVPHRAPSPLTTQQVKPAQELPLIETAAMAQTRVTSNSPLTIPLPGNPWQQQQPIQSVNANQYASQNTGNFPVVPSLSQISSVPPPHYRSPSPVSQMVSGMSTVGPPGYRSTSPVSMISPVAAVAAAVQNILTANMIPGVTVPMPPVGSVAMAPSGLPSSHNLFQPMGAPPNLSVPPPNFNVPPPHLLHQPPTQPVVVQTNPYTVQKMPLSIPMDTGPAGAPFQQNLGGFAGLPNPGMSNLSVPPGLRPALRGNLTIPVVGQSPQNQKEAMMQDILQRIRQRAPTPQAVQSPGPPTQGMPIQTIGVSAPDSQEVTSPSSQGMPIQTIGQSAPTPQHVHSPDTPAKGMPIQTIGQSAPPVSPTHTNTNSATTETSHFEVQKESKSKDDVLDWFSDKFEIKKEPKYHSTPVRDREEPECEHSDIGDISNEAVRKRIWEHNEYDDYGKKAKLIPSGDNQGEHFYSSTERSNVVDVLQQHSVENLNKAKDVILQSLADLPPEDVDPGEMQNAPHMNCSDLEEGELSEDSSVTESPLKSENDNRRVVIQNKFGNNIEVLCAANDIQRIQTIGSDKPSSPQRIVKAVEPSMMMEGSGNAVRHPPHKNLAAVDWSNMLQRGSKPGDDRERRVSAFRRIDSNDSRSVSQKSTSVPTGMKEEHPDTPDGAGILASSAALIAKTKQKIIARSQIKTLGDWLKLELEIENIQPLQKYIPYAFNTDLTTIPKGRRRKIKGKIRTMLEKEGKASANIKSILEEEGKATGVAPQQSAIPSQSNRPVQTSRSATDIVADVKSVHHGPPINPNYSPEVPNRQIQSELELVKNALSILKDSRSNAVIHCSRPSHHIVSGNLSVTLKNKDRMAPEHERAVRTLEPGSEGELQLISALQTVETEMVTMLQRTYFYGYPHRRVPKDLLLESELYSFKSPDEDVFLILMMPLSIKPYNKLKTMKKEIEALLKRLKGARNAAELKEELKNLHAQREGVIRSFTGYLNKKRVTKLQDLVNKYTLAYDYFKGQPRSPPDSALKFIRTTQIDLRQHLILAKQYLVMEEKKQLDV